MNAIVNVPSWNLLGYATEENNCLSLSSVLSYNLSEFNIIFSAYFFPILILFVDLYAALFTPGNTSQHFSGASESPKYQ